MRLIHLTDPHLSSLDTLNFGELRGKRRLGYLSWRHKRRHIHRAEVLECIEEAIRHEGANQILITGDLVHIGLEQEIVRAGKWLQSLGPPDQVRLVLGNHDVYAADSMAAIRRHWMPYVIAEGQVTSLNLPSEEVKLQIIGLCSSLPTAALMASGELGNRQLEVFSRLTMDPGVFNCVLIHHPPLPGMTRWRKALRDAGTFSEHLRCKPPQLILHGHTHQNTRAWVIPARSVAYGTASASSAHPLMPASYRVFDVSRHDTHWQLDMTLKYLDVSTHNVLALKTETLHLAQAA